MAETPRVAQGERALDEILTAATALHRQGKLADAERQYLRILNANPRHADARHRLGILQYQQGRRTEALANLERALAVRPGDAELLNGCGVVLQELGRRDEAHKAYEAALAANPDHADAWSNRGNLLREFGRLDEALASCDRALALRPDHPEALASRGNALQLLRRFDEALASYDRSLTLRPQSPETLSNRGVVLLALKRRAEALESFEKALALNPNHAEALNNRGVILQSLQRLDEAFASYQKAIALKPDYADAYNNLANTLRQLGRLDEAKASAEKAIGFAPRQADNYYTLAVLKKFSAGDPHLAAMEALAREAAPSTEDQRIKLHFALSKALGDAKEHERAFHHTVEANALKRRQVVYDEAATLQSFARTQAVFSAEFLCERRAPGDPSALPVLIVGMPRSGTTLIEQILASHPKVFGGGELDTFDKTLAAAGIAFPDAVPALSADRLAGLGAAYVASLRALAPTAERITDKMPPNFLYLGLIHLALPNARIIHVRRDPVDTALSCFSLLFSGDVPYAYDLGELGRYYRAYEMLMEHWRAALPPDAMLEVQYEDVVDDLEREARRLVAHCGLEWNDACLAFHATERVVQTASAVQVRQPIYRSSVGRWRPGDDALRPLLDALR